MNKVSIVGRGINPAKHLTLQAIECLQKADVIFGIEPETQTWKQLQEKYNLKLINDISVLYKCGAKDLNNYHNFIQFIKNQTAQYQHVALLIAGHPRLGVTFAQILEKENLLDTKVEFIESLSSFDVMLNDLAMDPLEQGSCILDANRLLLFQYELETSLNYYIYHVCSVGTQKLNYDNAQRDNQLELLQKYLLNFYSTDKNVVLCKAANGANENGSYLKIPLSELIQNKNKIDFGTTLLIPAELPKKINKQFLTSLQEI